MAQPLSVGYTVEDLDSLRAELGVAHLELDPWGSLIVSPATDEHETAVAVLASRRTASSDCRPAACGSTASLGRCPTGAAT